MKTLADLAAPAPVVRNLLEKDVQSQCVDWARARGYWARKFSSMTQRSVPDYLFSKIVDVIDESGGLVKFATEFKAPGKVSTDSQRDEQKAMRDAGWDVFECSDFETFKEKVRTIEEGGHSWLLK